MEQLEAKRKAKEEALNKWNNKIRDIQSGICFEGNCWYEDFFSFNLKHMCMPNGETIDGRIDFYQNYVLYPFYYQLLFVL